MYEISTITLGIVTGIFTTITLLLCKGLFYKIVLPWYLKTTYKGVNISGKWEASTSGFNMTLELKQHAHILSGILTISKKVGEKIESSSHYINGDVWEGFISLQSNTVDKRHLSYGNFLLKIESGRLLKGIYVSRRFKDYVDVGIFPTEVSFIREIG